ncbi:MAG: 6-carboxytetrahydropterin synthase [Bythopirellula sp.]|nr:6-carboxytetrahydropterin synthase [Bythopirellula sp.]
MPETYHIRLAKERFVFSAAHFITYNGDICEPLHGHNYHVTAKIHGPLDENHYVVDFIAVRDALQKIVDALDHRMLLPTQHTTIKVTESVNEITVTHGKKRWVFPHSDCVLLPLANTTAELLARHIAHILRDAVVAQTGVTLGKLSVAVDECDGQWGVCTLE